MRAMETFAVKHAAKIRGTLGCIDRVLFRAYLPLMIGFAQVYVNGHEWLARRLDRHGLRVPEERQRLLAGE